MSRRHARCSMRHWMLAACVAACAAPAPARGPAVVTGVSDQRPGVLRLAARTGRSRSTPSGSSCPWDAGLRVGWWDALDRARGARRRARSWSRSGTRSAAAARTRRAPAADAGLRGRARGAARPPPVGARGHGVERAQPQLPADVPLPGRRGAPLRDGARALPRLHGRRRGLPRRRGAGGLPRGLPGGADEHARGVGPAQLLRRDVLPLARRADDARAGRPAGSG